MIRNLTKWALMVPFLALLALGCGEVSQDAIKRSEIHYKLGVDYLHKRELPRAYQELLAAVQSNPNNEQVHYALGLVYLARRKYQDALREFQEAIDLDEKYSDAHNAKAQVFLELGQYDRAIEEAKLAMANVMYGSQHLALRNMAMALHQQGKDEEALEQLQESLRFQPKFCLGYHDMGKIFKAKGDLASAIAVLKEAIKLCPDRPEFVEPYYLLGLCLLQKGERQEAAKVLGQCAELGKSGKLGLECLRSLDLLGLKPPKIPRKREGAEGGETSQ